MCICGTCWECKVLKGIEKHEGSFDLLDYAIRSKEKKMIKFEDVRVGDRVKLVNENGDTAEVGVVEVGGHLINAGSVTFYDFDDWSVAEILPKPMPNKPGTILRGKYSKDTYVRMEKDWTLARDSSQWWSDAIMSSSLRFGDVEVEYEPE